MKTYNQFLSEQPRNRYYREWGWLQPDGKYIDGTPSKAYDHEELLTVAGFKGTQANAISKGWTRFFIANTGTAAFEFRKASAPATAVSRFLRGPIMAHFDFGEVRLDVMYVPLGAGDPAPVKPSGAYDQEKALSVLETIR